MRARVARNGVLTMEYTDTDRDTEPESNVRRALAAASIWPSSPLDKTGYKAAALARGEAGLTALLAQRDAALAALRDIADRLDTACENGATALAAGECADAARAVLAAAESKGT